MSSLWDLGEGAGPAGQRFAPEVCLKNKVNLEIRVIVQRETARAAATPTPRGELRMVALAF